MTLQLKEPKAENLPDFIALKHRYDHLDSGPRADLRKVAHFEDVADLPAYYRWLGGVPDKPGLQRIAFLLPHAGHSGDALPLGQQLRRRRIGEMRLFQVLRAEPPADLEYLRRLLIHADLHLDWQAFGKTLWYWGLPPSHSHHSTAKRRILQDYFTPVHTDDTTPA